MTNEAIAAIVTGVEAYAKTPDANAVGVAMLLRKEFAEAGVEFPK